MEDVTLSRRGEQAKGTLHLTPHHLIFVHTPPPYTSSESPARARELWITYPIIAFCTLRPSPIASRQPSSIRLRCRDFTFVCFYFSDDRKARDVFESIKAWTCKLGKIEKLYAFSYRPQGLERDVVPNGWAVYDPMREWRRQGIGDGGDNRWRISKINADYTFSPTYPDILVVPANISDITLNYAGKYRSRARIPVLSYLHPVNNCSITRCSQPMVGVRQNRSIQDEKLLGAIFGTTRNERPLSGLTASGRDTSNLPSPAPEREDTGSTLESMASGDLQPTDTEAIEDAVIAKLRGDNEDEADEDGQQLKKPIVYGAQQKNMIVDARPTINAIAMQAAGMGSENMDNYKFATKVYLGIDNIHVMRDSLNKVIETLKDSDLTPIGPSREQLAKSGWLKHIANMLDGVSLIARQVGLQHSHVLIHCSDGWDRTSQLSALSQICLDPYFRTLEGFIVLVEKDWLSFGHQFRYRTGFLSSEKWFSIENERIGGRGEDDDGTRKPSGDALAGAQKTFENAFLSAKGFFTKHNNDSKESINVDSDAEVGTEADINARKIAAGKGEKEKNITKVKETAPIFHQFLDATYQLMYQHPTRFEFNERFLKRLLYHLYSCQYGTFLFDNEKQRKEANISDKTTSVWNYFLSRKTEFLNASYDAEVNDNIRGKERLIFPRTQETRWWASGFGRVDEEMNGPHRPLQAYIDANGEESELSSTHDSTAYSQSIPVSRARTPIVTGVETSNSAVGVGSPPEAQKDGISVVAEAVEQEKKGDDSACLTTVQTIEEGSGQKMEELDLPEVKVQEPESAAQQQIVHEEALEELPDGLDPLGIGDVKDHVPVTKKAAVDRRREQLEALMQ